jgi:hypothetical protein
MGRFEQLKCSLPPLPRKLSYPQGNPIRTTRDFPEL